MSSAVMEAPTFDTTTDRKWIVVDPPTKFASHRDMRFGPRTYTAEQSEFIARSASEYRPLPATALPLPADFQTPGTIDLEPRRLLDGDRESVQSFNCGNETFAHPVRKWLRVWRWEDPDELAVPTLVFRDLDRDQHLAGYGAWSIVTAFGDHAVEPHLEIGWFGVDRLYKGQRTPGGGVVADVMYATVEAAARQDTETSGEVPLTLTCHVDNARGLKFWWRQGFEIIPDPKLRREDGIYYRLIGGAREP